MKDNPKEDNPKANCITGVGLWDAAGNLKAVLQSHKKTDEKFLQGLKDYDDGFSKIVCCCKGSYSLNMEETELSFFHLLGRYDTGVSPASKFGNPNDDADKFVNKLHEIMTKIKDFTDKKEVDLKPEEKKLLELYNSLINNINSTTLEHQFLGQTTENLLTFKVNGMNPIQFTINSLKKAKESNIEAEKKCIPRFKKLIEFLEQFETKPRSDSTASDATTADLSDTSSKSSDSDTDLSNLSLDKLRKEFQALEVKTGSIFNRKSCDETFVKIKSYEERINDLNKKCNKLFFGCSANEKTDIILLKEKIDNHKKTLIELGCKNNGGKRQTSKKQRKTRKTKKSKRATKKH
jgi:hypothetical protein